MKEQQQKQSWDLAAKATSQTGAFPSLYGYEQGKLQHLDLKKKKNKKKWCAEWEVTSQDVKEVPGRQKEMWQKLLFSPNKT